MKHLTIIRHAKSSWKDETLPDVLRPLNKRGKRDAPMMGERLAQRGLEVDILISSPATRALATAEVIAGAIGYPPEEIHVDDDLYGADLFALLDIVQGLDGATGSVILLGHNPGLAELVDYFSPRLIGNLPTGGIVGLTFDVQSWRDVSEAEPVSAYVDYPKMIRWG